MHHSVCGVEPIQEAQDTVVNVELKVVEVVELRARQERKMVARVDVDRDVNGDDEPEPVESDVGAQQPRSKHHRQEVGSDVLDRVGVDGDEAAKSEA